MSVAPTLGACGSNTSFGFNLALASVLPLFTVGSGAAAACERGFAEGAPASAGSGNTLAADDPASEAAGGSRRASGNVTSPSWRRLGTLTRTTATTVAPTTSKPYRSGCGASFLAACSRCAGRETRPSVVGVTPTHAPPWRDSTATATMGSAGIPKKPMN